MHDLCPPSKNAIVVRRTAIFRCLPKASARFCHCKGNPLMPRLSVSDSASAPDASSTFRCVFRLPMHLLPPDVSSTFRCVFCLQMHLPLSQPAAQCSMMLRDAVPPTRYRPPTHHLARPAFRLYRAGALRGVVPYTYLLILDLFSISVTLYIRPCLQADPYPFLFRSPARCVSCLD